MQDTAATLRPVPLPLRDDTFFGVCEALGQDFGFNANFLRIAFGGILLWNPLAAVGGYVALGLIVAFARLVAPNARVAPVATPQLVAETAPAAEAAAAAEAERVPLAA